MFIKACHWTWSWAAWIQSTPLHALSPRIILIVSCHLWLGVLSSLLITSFLTKDFSFLHVCYKPTYHIILDLLPLTKLSEECKLLCSLISNFAHPLLTFSSLVSHIPLSTLLSNTPSLFFFLQLRCTHCNLNDGFKKCIVSSSICLLMWLTDHKHYSPIQLRGPIPKGRYVMGLILCLLSSLNLSGSKFSGSG